MDSLTYAPAPTNQSPAKLSGWALPRGREPDEVSAAFASSIALKSLHDLVCSAPAWAGCWRAR